MSRYFWLCCRCGAPGATRHTHNGRPICTACVRALIREAVGG